MRKIGIAVTCMAVAMTLCVGGVTAFGANNNCLRKQSTAECDVNKSEFCENKINENCTKVDKLAGKENGTCENKENSTCENKENGTCENKENSTCENKENSTCENKENGICENKENGTCENKKNEACGNKENKARCGR